MRFFMSAAILILTLAACRPEAAAGPDPLQLIGRAWSAQEIEGVAVTGERPPALVFTANGRLSGFTGCNRMNGNVSVGKGTITIGDNIAATRMACAEPERMDMEHRFTTALPRAVRWEIQDGALVMSDAAGKTIIRFVEDNSEENQTEAAEYP